nr:integrase, catalytic region, zinc finger, CCHC-type, peptidase aspartic, catalytic [Tanacetum cinerariifolium]
MLSLMNLILRLILMDLQVIPTKPRRMTKPYSSHRFIANYFNAGNIKMEVKKKNIVDLEYEVVSLLEKEKENFKTIESLKSKDVEKGVESSEKVVSETENKSENDCQVMEKVCNSEENPNVIAPGMFKFSVSQSVSPISVTKTSCVSISVETKLKRKRRKRTSSKQNDKKVNNDVLRANRDFVNFSDLDTLCSVRRPKPSGVMWMRKGSSNTIKADFGFDYNDARNALCNARMNASVDVNDLFAFNDIIDSRCSKHMTGNRAILTNFVDKFLRTARFGNNDFVVIVGYGDVVIRSMTIKKVYYVEGLGHNLFSAGQFCDKGLEVTFRKSTCFVRNEDGVDFLTELDKHVRDLKNTGLENDFKISELEECTVHMIMPSKDNLYNGRKRIGFENPSYFEKAKDLRPTLYDEKQTSSLKPYVLNVILEKIIIDLKDEVVSLLEKEKANLKTIESLKSKGYESSEDAISELENQSENDCLMIEKECDKVENLKVIAPGMFKLSISQSVSPVSITKTS